MTAEELLNKLAQQELLDESTIASLRRQVARSDKKVTPQNIVKLLIDKGQLTAFQAKKLLGDEGRWKSDVAPPAASAKTGADKPDKTLKPVQPPAPPADKKRPPPADDELEFADDDDAKPAKLIGDDADVVELAPADSTPEAPPTGLTPLSTLTPLTADAAEIVEDSSGLTPLTAENSQVINSPAGLTPLDDLYSSDPLADAASFESAGGYSAGLGRPGRPHPADVKGKKLRVNRWDTPWLLLGGGGLLLLTIVGGVLLYVLTKGSATDMFDAAENAYREQSYSDAIQKYDKFLAAYPKDENASKARIRRALAELRLPIDSQDWQRALDTAHSVLPEIEGEDAVAEARPELASLLPDIAAGFTAKARGATDTTHAEQLLGMAVAAMELVANPSYIPTSERKPVIEARIDEIREEMSIVERSIQQDKDLVKAIDAIQNAADAGETAAAFTIRKELLRKYPGLVSNAGLTQAVAVITVKEQQLVRVDKRPIEPLAGDEPTAVQARIVLADPWGDPVAGLENRVAVFLIRDAVYGFDVASGRVLWRRFVGYETLIHPQRVSPEPGADVIITDSRRNEVVRVRAADGGLVWRLPVGEPFAAPSITRSRIYVTTQSGRVVELDPQSGACSQQVVLPQPALVGPGFDDKQPFLYQPGEHSNLYVLAAGDLECREVFYVGHRSGSVVTPPVLMLGHLFLAENAGADYSLLHVLAATSRGLKLTRPQDPIRLKGQVVVPPIPFGRRVLVMTNLGALHIYEVDPANEKRPVSDVASFSPTSQQPVIGYPLAEEGQLWVGDRRLTKFEVQTAKGTIERPWIENEGDVFLGPLALFGNTIVHVRQRRGARQVSVSAVRAESGKPVWRRDLGEPLAGIATSDAASDKSFAVTAQADLFPLNDAVIAAGFSDQPTLRAGVNFDGLEFAEQVEVAPGRFAYAGPPNSQRLLSYDPTAPVAPLKMSEMTMPKQAAIGSPAAFAGGVLVPSVDGRVYLFDPRTGGKQDNILPFQPPLEVGAKVVWARPAVLPANPQEFVVADQRRQLYRVAIIQQPQPHLESVAQVELDGDVVSPLAATSDTVFAVVRGTAGQELATFVLPKLTPGKRSPLSGRLAWGPLAIGDVVLVATDTDLHCFQNTQEKRWSLPLSDGPVVGSPLLRGGDFLVATQNGAVLLVSADKGERLARTDVGEPLAGGPIESNGRLLVGGSDGTIHIIPALSRP